MLVSNNKRGSVIVESVMLFPLVVMSVVALIFMMLFFYGQLSERVDMHIMLRSESGIQCENMFYKNKIETKLPVYKDAQQLYSKGIVDMDRKLILNSRKKEISARKYLINEGQFVRMTSILEGGISGEDE